jgi:hypothetical protein
MRIAWANNDYLLQCQNSRFNTPRFHERQLQNMIRPQNQGIQDQHITQVLTSIDVTNNDKRDVNLFFSHDDKLKTTKSWFGTLRTNFVV